MKFLLKKCYKDRFTYKIYNMTYFYVRAGGGGAGVSGPAPFRSWGRSINPDTPLDDLGSSAAKCNRVARWRGDDRDDGAAVFAELLGHRCAPLSPLMMDRRRHDAVAALVVAVCGVLLPLATVRSSGRLCSRGEATSATGETTSCSLPENVFAALGDATASSRDWADEAAAALLGRLRSFSVDANHTGSTQINGEGIGLPLRELWLPWEAHKIGVSPVQLNTTVGGFAERYSSLVLPHLAVAAGGLASVLPSVLIAGALCCDGTGPLPSVSVRPYLGGRRVPKVVLRICGGLAVFLALALLWGNGAMSTALLRLPEGRRVALAALDDAAVDSRRSRSLADGTAVAPTLACFEQELQRIHATVEAVSLRETTAIREDYDQGEEGTTGGASQGQHWVVGFSRALVAGNSVRELIVSAVTALLPLLIIAMAHATAAGSRFEFKQQSGGSHSQVVCSCYCYAFTHPIPPHTLPSLPVCVCACRFL